MVGRSSPKSVECAVAFALACHLCVAAARDPLMRVTSNTAGPRARPCVCEAVPKPPRANISLPDDLVPHTSSDYETFWYIGQVSLSWLSLQRSRHQKHLERIL